MKPIQNVELIEVPIVAGVSKYKIPTQTNFRGKKITLIEAIGENMCTVTPLGKDVLSLFTQTGYLTLDIGGKEKVKLLPLNSIDPSSITFPRPLDGFVINNDKSFVDFPASAFESADELKSFLLLFYFED